MSGGSWDYVYSKLEDVADRLLAERCLYRRALGAKMQLTAKAMHDIEWVDSGDSSEYLASVKVALGDDPDAEVLRLLKRDAVELIAKLEMFVKSEEP